MVVSHTVYAHVGGPKKFGDAGTRSLGWGVDDPLYTPCLKKVGHFYFFDNFGKSGPKFVIFTVKFRKDLQEKLELKLPPPLESVAALPCEKQVVNYTYSTVKFNVMKNV